MSFYTTSPFQLKRKNSAQKILGPGDSLKVVDARVQRKALRLMYIQFETKTSATGDSMKVVNTPFAVQTVRNRGCSVPHGRGLN